MASAIAGAVFWVVGKALDPLTDPVLQAWAASKNLGPNVENLKTKLLHVKAVLEPNVDAVIHNPALEELLWKLQDLAYDAEDVLDELDYFRIQDGLDGTFNAVDEHPNGCGCNLVLNATHTAKAVVRMIRLPRNITTRAVSKCLPCLSLHDDDDSGDEHEKEITRLEFNRVEVSDRIEDISQKLVELPSTCQSICIIRGPIDPNQRSSTAQSRTHTTSESIEPKLYGRDSIMKSIIYDITRGRYSGEDLTVLPIVGPGGIGKTALAQHIFHRPEVQELFEVSIWMCVSLNFNVDKLTEAIEKYVPTIENEKRGTAAELIGQRLKLKRFLLVLDDMWECSNEDEWARLLLPFRKSQKKGNIIIVTTRRPAVAETVTKPNHSIELRCLPFEEFKDLFLSFVFNDEQSRKDHPELLEIGDKIIEKLKGSPLAAKTVGRLLRV